MQNIVNVGKGDFKMPDDGERERKVQKFLGKRYEPYVAFAKKVLFEKVNNVVISSRLTNEPCVVVADTYGYSSFMDKIQKAQMFNSNTDGNPTSDFKKILEINPHHRVNQIILDRINVHFTLFRKMPLILPLRNSLSYSTRLQPSTLVSLLRILMSLCADSTRCTLRRWE
jgi:HSP90 family molecular chaperone